MAGCRTGYTCRNKRGLKMDYQKIVLGELY